MPIRQTLSQGNGDFENCLLVMLPATRPSMKLHIMAMYSWNIIKYVHIDYDVDHTPLASEHSRMLVTVVLPINTILKFVNLRNVLLWLVFEPWKNIWVPLLLLCIDQFQFLSRPTQEQLMCHLMERIHSEMCCFFQSGMMYLKHIERYRIIRPV